MIGREWEKRRLAPNRWTEKTQDGRRPSEYYSGNACRGCLFEHVFETVIRNYFRGWSYFPVPFTHTF